MSSYKDLRIVDNFYQTSAFFPMPTVMIGTLTDEACAKLVKVPRIFLPLVLKGCVSWAKENNVTLITAEHMDIINDKRAKEKKQK